ncbi:unnamed protein product [Amoebophrya sp. A120]|nr:unnamed protein product [Amoebophrya sp. A120]|eukprot:GSA120T00014237001.1
MIISTSSSFTATSKLQANAAGGGAGGAGAPAPAPSKTKTANLIRLTSLMAERKLCARQEANEFLRKGMVKVNGKILHKEEIFQQQLLFDPTKTVVELTDRGRCIQENKVTVLLNKPKHYACIGNKISTSDASSALKQGSSELKRASSRNKSRDNATTPALSHPSARSLLTPANCMAASYRTSSRGAAAQSAFAATRASASSSSGVVYANKLPQKLVAIDDLPPHYSGLMLFTQDGRIVSHVLGTTASTSTPSTSAYTSSSSSHRAGAASSPSTGVRVGAGRGAEITQPPEASRPTIDEEEQQSCTGVASASRKAGLNTAEPVDEDDEKMIQKATSDAEAEGDCSSFDDLFFFGSGEAEKQSGTSSTDTVDASCSQENSASNGDTVKSSIMANWGDERQGSSPSPQQEQQNISAATSFLLGIEKEYEIECEPLPGARIGKNKVNKSCARNHEGKPSSHKFAPDLLTRSFDLLQHLVLASQNKAGGSAAAAARTVVFSNLQRIDSGAGHHHEDTSVEMLSEDEDELSSESDAEASNGTTPARLQTMKILLTMQETQTSQRSCPLAVLLAKAGLQTVEARRVRIGNLSLHQGRSAASSTTGSRSTPMRGLALAEGTWMKLTDVKHELELDF